MMITNQRYTFTPPGHTAPIKINGVQNYSPGQMRQVDVYLLFVPPELQSLLPDRYECDTWGDVLRTLARVFCDGDEKAAKELIQP